MLLFLCKGIYIVAAKRTAFGTFGGSLKGINQTQLQTTAAKAALDAAGLKGEQVDTVIVGNVIAVSWIEDPKIETLKASD